MSLAIPGVPGLGPTELILIILVLVLLFGAKKLPEIARGSGRALRIFKAETKGLLSDDDEPLPPPSTGSTQAPAQNPVQYPVQNTPLPPPETTTVTPRPVEDPYRSEPDR
jgi:sec-independent protein translocase protein TatA